MAATETAAATGAATEAAATETAPPVEAAVEANAVTVGAEEFAFNVDAADFAPGTNEITFTNSGTQVHHLQLVALESGTTVEDLLTGLEAFEAGEGFPAFAAFAGGVGQIAPGGSASTVAELNAGTYALLCFVPDPADGAPHFAKGMAALIEVAGEENAAELPEADLVFAGSDYALDGPASAAAGELVLRLDNAGAEPHEANVLRLGEGETIESMLAFFTAETPPEGPPPFAPVGGAQAIFPGDTTLAKLDLEAGEYAVICFVPNAEGVPHFALGMVAPLTVE